MEELGYGDPLYDNSEEALDTLGVLSTLPGGGASKLSEALDQSNARIRTLEGRYQKTQKESEELYRRQRDILDAAARRILTQQAGPGRAESLLAIAAALGKPTRTGRFSETVGHAAGMGADILGERRKAQELRSQLADKYGLESVNAGLGMVGADERQALTLLNSELNRNTRLQLAGRSRSSPLPAGVEIEPATGFYLWTDPDGVKRPHTIEQFYAMQTGSKAAGSFPYKTPTGPFGPTMATQLPGAPQGVPITPPITSRGAPTAVGTAPAAASPVATAPVGAPAAPASAQPAPRVPIEPVSTLPSANEPTQEEIESLQPIFTPFAGLPRDQSLFTPETAQILQKQAALAFRKIPKFPTQAPAMGPQAVQLKAQIEEDAKRGTQISKDLRDRAAASEDILKAYTKMYEDLNAGMRTGRVGIFLTTLEEAMSGVLPEAVTRDFIDSARKSREQSFDKLALDALTRTLKAIYGARITNLDLETAIRAAPGRSISERASYVLMNAIADKSQEQIFRQQAWEEYRYRGGTADGFDGWYRANLNPYFENTTRDRILKGGRSGPVDRRQQLLDELKKRQTGGQ